MTDVTDIQANDILAALPHRAPFVFVDKVLSLADEAIEAVKLVSFNEPYFQGHFPSQPVMPGVLIVEAMAQAAGLLMVYKHDVSFTEATPFYLASIKQARFKRVVRPGDSLVLKITLEKHRGAVWQFSGHAYVGNELAAQAEFINMEGSAG